MFIGKAKFVNVGGYQPEGVEDGMGAACDPTNDSERCGLRGNWCYIHHCYPATCEKLGLGIHAKPAVPVATPAMKDEVESATTDDDDSYVGWARYVRRTGYPARLSLCDSIDEGAFKIYRRPR